MHQEAPNPMLLIVVLLMSFVLCAGQAAAGQAATSQATAQSPGMHLTGSWTCVDNTTQDVFLFTFQEDRTYRVTSPFAQVSDSHGVWQRADRDRFRTTDVALVYAPDSHQAEFVHKTRARFQMLDREAMGGQLKVTLSLRDGTEIDEISLAVNCERIQVEPLLVGSDERH